MKALDLTNYSETTGALFYPYIDLQMADFGKTIRMTTMEDM